MIYISQKMEDHRAAHEYLFKGFKGFKLPKWLVVKSTNQYQ